MARAFHAGRAPVRTRDVAVAAISDEAQVRPALDVLAKAGLVRELAGGGWVPGRPLGRLTLDDVRRAARGNGLDALTEPGYVLVGGHLKEADDAAARALAVTYEQLVAAEHPEAALETVTPATEDEA